MRQFEKFLVNIEPAVAAVETNTNPAWPPKTTPHFSNLWGIL